MTKGAGTTSAKRRPGSGRRSRSAGRTTRPRIGLALAGGGPLGAAYEIGALCAIEEAFHGLDLTRMHAYVGVSAGGFIAAALANGIGTRSLVRSFIENDGPGHEVFEPSLLQQPAWRAYAEGLSRLPRTLLDAAWHVVTRQSWSAAFERLGRVLPAGVFSNAPLEAHLRRIFTAPGRSNDFRRLKSRLVLVATDLDRGEPAPFGTPGWDHVPISVAVQASAALPGLYPPVRIDGRDYVDGALKKTLHASVLLDEGVDLLIALNPLVPFDATRKTAAPRVLGGAPATRIPPLASGGLPIVLSQTLRALIHSRLRLGMKGYAASHPQTDIVLFEPDRRDTELFLANSLSTAQRRHLAEHAYERTRALLREEREAFRARFARHGLRLDDSVLDDGARTLLGVGRRIAPTLADALLRLEDELDGLESLLAAGQGTEPPCAIGPLSGLTRIESSRRTAAEASGSGSRVQRASASSSSIVDRKADISSARVLTRNFA